MSRAYKERTSLESLTSPITCGCPDHESSLVSDLHNLHTLGERDLETMNTTDG